MGTIDIDILSLVLCFLLLGVPILTSLYLKLDLIRPILLSVFRMTGQLILIGLFLRYNL